MSRAANWRVCAIFKFEAKGGVSAIEFVGRAGHG